jgi:hypothetical protein
MSSQNPLTGTLDDKSSWIAKKTSTVDFSPLSQQIEYLSGVVAARISEVKAKKSAVSVADMFDLQATMTKLSQYSEAASSVIAGLNSVASTISRNIKG